MVSVTAERVLKPTKYNHKTPIAHLKTQGRQTVSMAFTDGGRILLVQPKCTGKEKKFIFPQGGISLERDQCLIDAVEREGSEELQFDFRCFKKNKDPVLLGECLNPMHRSSSYKHLFVVAVPVWYRDWVKLNHENKKYVWVENRKTLMTCIGWLQENRPVKFWAMINAIDDMAKAGMLSWTSGFNTAR